MSRFIRYSRFFALLASALLPLNAHSDGWSPDDARQNPGSFALGFIGGIAAHEAGHYVVARSLGYRVSHDRFSITYPGAQFTHADQLKVASAGFQTQWLLAELFLRDKGGNEIEGPANTVGAGVICAHLGITLAYLTVAKNHKLGDTVGMSQATGRTNNQLALALAVPGILDAWRLFGHDVPEWVPQVSLMTKGVAIARIWTY